MFQVALKSVPSLCIQFHVVVDFYVVFECCESRCNCKKIIFLMSSRDVRPVLNCLVPRGCTSETNSCVLGISGTWVNVSNDCLDEGRALVYANDLRYTLIVGNSILNGILLQ